MKNINKILVLLMVLIFTLSIIGCSAGGEANKDSNADTNIDQENDAQSDKNGDEGNNAQDDDGQDGNNGDGDSMDKIKESNKIVWGTNAAFAPFEMREGDDVIGIDAEIAKRIADKIGVELVVEDMDFDPLITALQSNKIDFIAAGFTIKPDRENQVLFTDTYFKAVQVIMVKEGNDDIKSVADLEGKKIGVQNATTGDFEASDIPDAEVFRFNNGIEAALDLNNGNIDAIIIDNLPAQMLVEKNPGIVILDLEEKPFEDEEYAIAVRKNDNELQQIINEVLNEMNDSGEIEDLVKKYSID